VKFRSTTAVGAVAAVAAVAALAATLAPHPNATASAHPAARWSATWASAMQPPVPGNDTTGPNWSGGFADQTVRQVIRVSSGGSRVRVRLSNLYGTKPLRVTGATIARTRDGAAVEPGTVRSLTFHGARSATISVGRAAASDPAVLPVAAQAVADPADPEELNPAYNSGDFLHPNDAGYRAIAAIINPNEL
jgi:hypothetical protein